MSPRPSVAGPRRARWQPTRPGQSVGRGLQLWVEVVKLLVSTATLRNTHSSLAAGHSEPTRSFQLRTRLNLTRGR